MDVHPSLHLSVVKSVTTGLQLEGAMLLVPQEPILVLISFILAQGQEPARDQDCGVDYQLFVQDVRNMKNYFCFSLCPFI